MKIVVMDYSDSKVHVFEEAEFVLDHNEGTLDYDFLNHKYGLELRGKDCYFLTDKEEIEIINH
jgi:hypothetical protein